MPILNDNLRAQVERYKRRAQRLTLIEGVAQTLAVFLGLLAVTFTLDRWLFLPLVVRVALTVLVWGATAAGIVRFIYRPLRKRWSDIEVAFNVEAAHPELNEELESVVELAASRDPDEVKGSPQLIEALVNDLARRTTGLDFARAISPKRAALSAAAAVALMAGLGFYATVATDDFALLFKRFANPLARLPRASTVKLSVKPGDALVEAGSGFTVRAVATGRVVRRAALFLAADGLSWMRFDSDGVTTNAVGGARASQFEFALPGVRSNALYFVRAGDAESARFHITAARGPRLQRFTLTYHYPPYTKLPPKTLTAETADIAAVTGSRVVIQAESNERLRDAALELNGTPPQPLPLADDRNVFAEIHVEHDAEFKLRVTSAAGFRNTDAISYHIKALADQPPTVKLLDPDADVMLARPELLPLRFEADDDFGLQSAYLVHNDKREQMPVAGFESFDLARAGYKPGDEVTFWVEVEDNSPAHQPGRTEPRTVRISEMADLSLQSKDFATLRKLRDEIGRARRLLADARASAERLRADAAQGRWDANLASRAGALGRDLAGAQDCARAALGFVETCVAATARTARPQTLRDWENVANQLDQIVERAAFAQRSAEPLAVESAQPAGANGALQACAGMSGSAADVAARLDEAFTRLYDARQMDALATLARRVHRGQQRVADTFEHVARTGRKQSWQLAAQQQQDVTTATKLLAAGLPAADAVLPANAAALRSAADRIATAAVPRQERIGAEMFSKRNHRAKDELGPLIESLQKTREELARVDTAAAGAANTARAALERSRVELSQRFPLAAQAPAAVLRERISNLVMRLDAQSEPHLTQVAGDRQWGRDLLLVREALRKLTETVATQPATIAAELCQLGAQLNLLERERDLRLLVRHLRALEAQQTSVVTGLEQAAVWQRLRFGQCADIERDIRAELAPFGERLTALVGRVAPVDATAGREIEAVGRHFAGSNLLAKLDEAAKVAEAGDKLEAQPKAAEIKAMIAALRAALERILKNRMETAHQAREKLQQNQPPPAQQIEKLAQRQEALAQKTAPQPAAEKPTPEKRQELREEQKELRADAKAVERQLMAQAHPDDEERQPDADKMRDLHDAALRVAETEREQMNDAAQALRKNKPAEAAQHQQAAAQKLHQTAQQLADIQKHDHLAAQAAQAAALAQQEEKMAQTSAASQPQALPAQAQPQRSLASQTQALAQSAQKSSPTQAASQLDAAQQAMQQAAKSLQAANKNAATSQQQAAAQNLKQAAQSLADAAKAASPQADAARQQLQQAEQPLPNQPQLAKGYEWLKKLNEIAAQQVDVAKRAAANEPPQPLATKQGDVKQQMQSQLQSDPSLRAAQQESAKDKIRAAAQAVAELARKEGDAANRINQLHNERQWRPKEDARHVEEMGRATQKIAQQAPDQAAPFQRAQQAMQRAADAIKREDYAAAQQQLQQSAQALKADAKQAKEQAKEQQKAHPRDRRQAAKTATAASAMDQLARRQEEFAGQVRQTATARDEQARNLAGQQTQMKQDLQKLGRELATARDQIKSSEPELAKAMEGAPEAASEKIPPTMQSSAEQLQARNTLQGERDARSAEQALSRLAEQLARAAEKEPPGPPPAQAQQSLALSAAMMDQTAAALDGAGQKMDDAKGEFEQGRTQQGHPPAQAAADTLQMLAAQAATVQQQQMVASMQQMAEAAKAAQMAQQQAQQESQSQDSMEGAKARDGQREGTAAELKLSGSLADLDKLPAELKDGLAHGMRENYPPEYEQLIKQYFQKLSKSAK
ncbi:MAG: DUF4175 family protein [Verrucomicrobia bacterium]|nr:DUF4175 family protein [Verrucomicrobiota bacterium]